MRYISSFIENDLQKKMVLLSGPRQTGKTTLAKTLCKNDGVYLNWDIRTDQRIIREIGWPKDAPMIVLDELHKYAQWKNFLKGVVDEFQNTPSVLVTGSAKLNAFRFEGDALTGRYFSYRLHPIDVAEAKLFYPQLSAEDRLDHLLNTGGFPEAFLNPSLAERLRNDRFDLVIQEDVRDFSKTTALRKLQLLIELLRERVGGTINYANLASDIGVSAPTIRSWIELLEQLFIIFTVMPYHQGMARSLRKEAKLYFYDCAAAYRNNNNGPMLENVVASALLKYCHLIHDTSGAQMKLWYYRDREKREVDFLITNNRNVTHCIEVKSSNTKVSPYLEYLTGRLNPLQTLQVVKNCTRRTEIRGIRVLPMAQWLDTAEAIVQ